MQLVNTACCVKVDCLRNVRHISVRMRHLQMLRTYNVYWPRPPWTDEEVEDAWVLRVDLLQLAVNFGMRGGHEMRAQVKADVKLAPGLRVVVI